MVAAMGGCRRRALLASLLGIVVLASRPAGVGAQQPAMRWDGVVEHVSVAQAYGWGNPTGTNRLSRHAVSSDGRYVVFAGEVPNDPYPTTTQIFRRDRLTGQTEMVIGARVSEPPVVSADGNQYAFQSCEEWLRPDYMPACDVYVVDLRYWSILNASTALDGTLSDASSSEPVLSRDGRFVVFKTNASALLPFGSAPGQFVIRDRDADGNGIFDEPGNVTIELVSVSTTGAAADGENGIAEVSNDGRFVAFTSRASNLVGDDTNETWDVFLRDRQSGDTRRININQWTGQQGYSIDPPTISMTESGDQIAFDSNDSYLSNPASGNDDINNALDVYVYDRQTFSLTRVDVGAGGQLGDDDTYSPQLSADGRYVALVSKATNIAGPVTPGRAHAYVHDRLNNSTTRISLTPDGLEPDADSFRAGISADGSFVVFGSRARNLAPTTTGLDGVFGASYFELSPATLTIPSGGGEVNVQVSAQSYTQWNPEYFYSPWLSWTTPIWGQGNGSITFTAPRNETPESRSETIRFNSRTIQITQEPGLSLTGLTPTSGPNSGGTVVTVTGTGFDPQINFFVDRVGLVPVQFVNSTTVQITMPPNQTGDAYIWACAPMPAYSCALLYTPFRYLDTTPPQIYPYVSGELTESGWYRDNVTVDWWVWDPETPSTVTLDGCSHADVTTDTSGTTFTCTATSEGGTASASTTVRRDSTPASAGILKPEPTLYKLNQVVNANYFCSDAGSGVQSCQGDVPSGSAFDTTQPGYRDFYVNTIDRAGNFGYAMRTYAVSTGQCVARPSGLVAWWPADYDYRDVIGGNDGVLTNSIVGDFVGGISRGSMHFLFPDNKYVQVGDAPALKMQDAMTLSAWLFSGGAADIGVIAGREGEYLLGRGADGKIRYSIANTYPGWGWVDTGVSVPQSVWTHVALTYDGAMIRLYVNGQLAYSRAAGGTIGDAEPALNDFRIGARQLPSDLSEYAGNIDNVEVVSRALSDAEIQSAFLSADVGYCPDPTTLTFVPAPQRATYGQSTARLTATLNRAGAPEPNTWVQFKFRGTAVGSAQTNASGVAYIDVTLPAGMAVGTYAGGANVTVPASAVLAATSATADFIVDKAPAVLTWNTPAPIVYGTALGSAQLNASANVGGSFTYAPSFGTVLGAGPQTLSVTFTPSSSNYLPATASVVVTIDKATPSMMAAGDTFTYDGAPHAAIALVTGVGGASLSPVTFTYNDVPATPVNAGAYAVVASFAGNQNYNSAYASTTLTIDKATPTVTATGGTFTYDGAPHAATGTALGLGEETLGPVTFTYNGSTDVPVNAGSYAVVASFAGNANYNSASANATITIAKAQAVVTWGAPASIVYGTALSVAQLNATAGVPGGFSYSPSAGSVLAAGAGRPLAVTFTPSDSTNYLGASANTTIDVLRAPLTITTADASKVFGAPLPAFTVSAAGLVNGDTLASLTGTLAFSTAATASSAVGSYAVTPSGLSSPNYVIGFANGVLTVVKGSVNLTLSTSPEPSGFNQPMTFTATVAAAAPAVGSPSGTVSFYDGTTLLGTAALVSGSASLTTAGLPAGSRTIEARYSGDASFAIGSRTETHVIRDATSTPSIVVTSSRNPATTGQSVTLTATVSVGSGSVAGTIEFYDGGTLLGPGVISAGRATFTTSALAARSHAIVARYVGSATLPPAYSPVFVQAVGAASWKNRATTMTLSASPNPVVLGGSVTLTAIVDGSTSTTPTGRILLMVDGLVVGDPAGIAVTPGTGGTASVVLSQPGLAHGSHTVTATYLGDSTFKGSTAAVAAAVN